MRATLEASIHYCEGCNRSKEGGLTSGWTQEGTSIKYAQRPKADPCKCKKAGEKNGFAYKGTPTTCGALNLHHPLTPATANWCPTCPYIPPPFRPGYRDRTRIFKEVR